MKSGRLDDIQFSNAERHLVKLINPSMVLRMNTPQSSCLLKMNIEFWALRRRRFIGHNAKQVTPPLPKDRVPDGAGVEDIGVDMVDPHYIKDGNKT
ncbi:hypothetical protein PR048_003337 [Dryococelus australis]|uniref:Uncharacterized protein n=1 Tax=Dryococelus australis TaxID=614101 RepID=A0ABQ9IMT8_9NEOP|nr:hypothetical protein PR048_003337 [Dryococelus australis]